MTQKTQTSEFWLFTPENSQDVLLVNFLGIILAESAPFHFAPLPSTPVFVLQRQ